MQSDYKVMEEDLEYDKISRVFKSDIEFEEELEKNEVFLSYFNTFLSLPIFRHHQILTWIRNYRAPLFLKAAIYNEYKLCYLLAASPVVAKQDFISHEDFVIFQRNHLNKISSIQRFKQYLAGSVGENLIEFWLDAERYRWQTLEKNRIFYIKEVEEKFINQYSLSKLIPDLKDAMKKQLNQIFDLSNKVNLPIKSTLFVPLQKHVLECIQKYWIPKYILHCFLTRKAVLSRWRKGKIRKNSNILSVINKLKEIKKREDNHNTRVLQEAPKLVLSDKLSHHKSLHDTESSRRLNITAEENLKLMNFKNNRNESNKIFEEHIRLPTITLKQSSLIKSCNILKDERTPLIKRLETTSMTVLAKLVCTPPINNIALPTFSGSFVYKNKQMEMQNKKEPLDSLIAALNTDFLAGQPLLEYIVSIGDKQAEANYKFWIEVNKTFHNTFYNETIFRQKQYQTIINLFLASNASYNISLSSLKKQELCRYLTEDGGLAMLIEANDQIALKLLPIWEAFCKSDKDSFFNDVSMLDQLEKIQDIEDSRCSSNLRSTLNRNKFNSRRMWKALELALTISKPIKHQLFTISSLSSSDEDSGDDELSMEQKSLRRNELFLINNDSALTHKYMEWKISSSKFDINAISHDTNIQEQQSQEILLVKPHKPRSFHEILMDSLQLDFFKQYLTKEKEETPLLFWIAVESMRTKSKDAMVRQGKTQAIVKRFFGSANQGKDLKCNAEVISQIPLADKVTPAMLISAQACVAKSLEESWYSSYLATFSKDDETDINIPVYNKHGISGKFQSLREKTLVYWRMFVRNITVFTKGISNKDTFRMFRDFLKLQYLMSGSSVGDTNNFALDKISSSVIVINHKHVFIEKLVADLYFYCEVQKYRDFSDAVVECAKLGNYSNDDELVVVKKAYAIIDCFINSLVAPTLQINISREQAETIMTLAANGIIERGLFHDATLSIFTSLFYFWKKFCTFRFVLPNLILPKEKSQRNDRSAKIALKQEALKLNKFKKVSLPEDEDCSKIMFSLQFGLRIGRVREGKRAKSDKKLFEAN
ncbi:regulator of G-protein signaling protein-like isoform X2 [Hydra vulgaris]|uniref:regulator of G-protein signaling protein-like isoform X2 n=1 Tax=Hydra vulgaris TaxID=6087 RepID=UPI001F5F56E5|nr:regulator of G-protein signaling protein-like isoform X2 [Hydra vulgaris]